MYYKIPSKCCNKRLTAAIDIQQQNPIIIGFPPFFTSLTMSVLRPIALIAITIKNLLNLFRKLNMLLAVSNEYPEQNLVIIVVMMDADTK